MPGALVELVDERLYHVDLTFCPLDERRAICAPLGWDAYGRKVVEALVPEPLWLDGRRGAVVLRQLGGRRHQHRDARRAAHGSGAILEGWGFSVVESQVGEFLKAGGGCRCLTLALDVDLGGRPAGDGPLPPPG